MLSSVANFFPITNPDELRAPYRLWQVTGLVDTGDLPHNLNLAAKRVAWETKSPVAPAHYRGGPALALPVGACAPDRVQLTPQVVQLHRLDETREAVLTGEDGEGPRVGREFLRFALRGAIMRDQALWGGASSAFQIDPQASKAGVDMFSGFNWALVFYLGRPYIVIDPTFRYHDSSPPAPGPDVRMRHALYVKGRTRYDVQLLALLDHTVAEAQFASQDGQSWTVLSYSNQFNPDVNLDPAGSAVIYRYPGRLGQQFYGALECVRLRRRTHEIQHTSLHRESVLAPAHRLWP